MRHLLPLAAIATLALTTACNMDSTTPSGTTLLNTDVAMVSGDVTAQDVEVMRGPGGRLFGLHLFADPARFDCTRETPPGLTITRTCTFTSVNGTAQTGYDPLTTASISMSVHVSGSIDRGNLSATIERTRQLTVSGLGGQETSMTWNGTGSGTSTRVRTASDGGTRSYEMSANTTITNVVIPVPRSDNSWPTSGTIHRTVTVTKGDGPSVTRDVTITFNGTSTVTITVNGEAMDYDLSERGRPRRHR
jgi:hypothetical protein